MKIALFATLAVCLFAFDISSPEHEKWNSKIMGEENIQETEILAMYKEWLLHYGKSMLDLGEVMGPKFTVFKEKVYKIVAFNARKESWTKGLNQFSDMTDKEFNDYYHISNLGAEQHCSATERNSKPVLASGPVPNSKDWTEEGWVSDVKDQGNCGSCWTFSTTGSLEAHYYLAKDLHEGNRPNFSEQQLLDCATANFDNYGCMGGLPSHAFEYISWEGGLATEEDYPYKATDSGPCAWDAKTMDANAIHVTTSVNITEGDEVSMKNAIAEHGPVAVAYQVASDFRDYSSGVYHSTICKGGTMDVNHAVLAVGYGTEGERDFWHIKNSWGQRWGVSGYFKIQRGENMCGIGICNSFPESVW